MKDYSDCDVIVAPKTRLRDSVYLRERLLAMTGVLVRAFRRNLPQISIAILLLLGAVCFTYYYYVID